MLNWIAWAVALASGLMLGWALQAQRRPTDNRHDWKVRLKARDVDLRAAQNELTDVTARLQRATDELAALRTGRTATVDEAEPGLVDDLRGRLAAAEGRIAALESELTAAADLHCPDPGAHQAPVAPWPDPPRRSTSHHTTGNVVHLPRPRVDDPSPPTPPREGPEPSENDLTRIHGIDPAVEHVLAGMGIITFAQVAEMTAEDASVIEDLLDGTTVDLDSWTAQARALLGDRSASAEPDA